MRPVPVLRRLAPFLALCIILAAACGPRTEETIPRETFVEVYLQLRVAALDSPDAELPESERDRILQEHGVTPQDLVTFVEVHSLEPSFMRDVWTEIEDRLNVETLPPP